jgi:hypothetical protein
MFKANYAWIEQALLMQTVPSELHNIITSSDRVANKYEGGLKFSLGELFHGWRWSVNS